MTPIFEMQAQWAQQEYNNAEDLMIYVQKAFSYALDPQSAKEATMKITELRKNPNYRMALFCLLISYDESAPKFKVNPLQYLSQLKIITCNKDLTNTQKQCLKRYSIVILQKLASSKTHKLLRKIVQNITILCHDQWFDLAVYESYILDSGNNTEKVAFLISSLIGIPQSYKYNYTMDRTHKQKLNLFSGFINVLISLYKRTACPYQMHYIVKFIQKFIVSLQPDRITQYSKYFQDIFSIGYILWEQQCMERATQIEAHDYSVNGLQISKARKWYSKLIKFYFMRQQEYQRTHPQYMFLDWRKESTKKTLVILINFLHNFSIQRTKKLQECEQEVNLNLIEFFTMFFKKLKPVFMFHDIQKFLYVTIPKMLYTLKNVFDSEGILLKFMGAYTKDNKSRYKSALLKFWVALNSMDFNMAELKMQKMLNYSITDVKNNNRQVQALPSNILNMKFIFQKLTESQLFFSPFAKRKQLQDKHLWDFESDQSWIIVAYDLLKANFQNIANNPSYQQIKESIPSILISYIVPKILNKNPLIQTHAIILILTFNQYFKSLNISSNIINEIQRILKLKQDKQAADIMFRALPTLSTNSKISDIIVKNIDLVLNYYIQVMDEQQDYNIVKCFNSMVEYYGKILQHPTKYFQQLVDKMVQVIKSKEQKDPSIYIQCIESLMKLQISLNVLRKKMSVIFRYAMYDIQSAKVDQLLQDQLLRLVSHYINIEQQTNNQMIIFFIVCCLSLSNFDRTVMQILEKSSNTQLIRKDTKNLRLCEQTMVNNVIWILQLFSVRQQMFKYNQLVGDLPIALYLRAIDVCVERFKIYRHESQEEYLQVNMMIIKGLIGLAETKQLVAEVIVGEIWNIGILQIYSKIRNQIIKLCRKKIQKQNSKQQKQRMEQNIEKQQITSTGEQIDKEQKVQKRVNKLDWQQQQLQMLNQAVIVRIVELVSSLLFLHIQEAQICFSETTNFVQDYLIMVEACLCDEQIKNRLFRKKVLFGLCSLFEFEKLDVRIQKPILQGVCKIYEQVSKKQKKYEKYLDNDGYYQQKQLSQNIKDWPSQQSFQESSFSEEGDSLDYDITMTTRDAWYDALEHEAILSLVDSIENVHPQARQHKELMNKIKKYAKQVNYYQIWDYY